jgi:tetratricopeptide (TPR) repeat protein
MAKASNLTELLFGVPSNIEVYPEITRGFLGRGEYGIDAFRRYVRELGYSDAKVEEILLEIYREAKRRCADTSYEDLLAAICSEIGAFYLDLGYEGAEKFLLEAFNLRNRLYSSEKAFLLVNTMNKLGIFYVQNGKVEKAEIMFEDAYTIMKELYERSKEFEFDCALAAINLGTFYFETYRPDEGLKYLFEALEHKHALPCGGAVPYFNIALCYQDLEEYDKAVEFYIKASAIALDKGFVDVKESLGRALKIASPEQVHSKVEELLSRGEIDRRKFVELTSILGRLD